MTGTLAAQVLDACRTRGLTVATAESCTGGLISAALTAVAGSSDVFVGGVVSYENTAKVNMLAVSSDDLTRYGAVSEQVAVAMAVGAKNSLKAAVAVSVTGIAGPGGSDHKPEGRVCFAISGTNAHSHAETIEFGALGRDNVRMRATDHALALLLAAAES